MREKELRELINYRMQRAMETLEEARLMAGIGHWNACANRLYYAAFLIEATADFIESIRLLIEAEA